MTELKQVVRRAANGDGEAAGSLFDTYYPRVFRYAAARLANPADAEDVAAETFARLLRELGRFKWRGAGFEAWLFRIAANLVVDHIRARTRERVEEDPSEDTAATAALTPEESLMTAEMTRELKVMLARLPAEQQEVLVLRFAGGLDTQETGAVMGKKPNAVRQLQFRALESMRRMMREEAAT